MLANTDVEEGDRGNQQCLPALIEDLVKISKYLPLWSGVMTQYFPSANVIGSSATVESNLNDVKNRIFGNVKLPLPVDDFLKNFILSADGANMLAKSGINEINQSNTKKPDRQVRQQHQEVDSNNYPYTEDFSRLANCSYHRQGKLFAPLLGFFLASLFPSLSIAKLPQGSVRFQYDPVPQIQLGQAPSINIFQTPLPTWEPITKPSEEEYQLKPTEESLHHIEEHITYPELISTNLGSPSEYLVPPETQPHKRTVKRAISSRYLSPYRRNRFGNTRRRYPDYFEYDNYEDLTTPRLKIRKRNQGRRPAGFDYNYDYEYDYGNSQKRQQQRRRLKNKNRKGFDSYSDEDLNEDIEPVTAVVRPRQQTTTTPTTTETTTTPTTTMIINGTTSGTTTSGNATASGYGYGTYSGNENISITYGPPSVIKPVYGVPGSAYGSPLNEWVPSYLYEPSTSNLHNPYYGSSSYNAPSTPLGAPVSSYDSATYSYHTTNPNSPYSSSISHGIPGSSYRLPNVNYFKQHPINQGSQYSPPSTSYGVPSNTYGVPSQAYGPPSSSTSQSQNSLGVSSYQSYQLPFTSWYGRSASHSDIVRKAQDIIKYD